MSQDKRNKWSNIMHVICTILSAIAAALAHS